MTPQDVYCPGPPNELVPQIEPHPNSFQYPLINYLDLPQVLVEMKMSEEEVYQIGEWIEETKIMKFLNQRKGNENESQNHQIPRNPEEFKPH